MVRLVDDGLVSPMHWAGLLADSSTSASTNGITSSLARGCTSIKGGIAARIRSYRSQHSSELLDRVSVRMSCESRVSVTSVRSESVCVASMSSEYAWRVRLSVWS